ncbi:MAG: hypothetical protein V7K89_08070 [Nostoc sp.]|uniref:hypothetical protein n=1 Tax=Nostoc sp. TaxID=1180 RepID=UPI002FF53249
MVEPLTAAVIVCLFFSEAIKEGEKALTKWVSDTFAQLVPHGVNRDPIFYDSN